MEINKNVFSSYLTSSKNYNLGEDPKFDLKSSKATHSDDTVSISKSYSIGEYGGSLNGFEYNECVTDSGLSAEELASTSPRDGFYMICHQFLNNGLDNHGEYEIDPVFGYKIHRDMTYVAGRDVFDASSYGSIAKYVASHIEGGFEPGSFLITNLTSVISQYKQWVQELPMIEAHYAVKCNPDPVILRLLASLGCHFDCATMGEIDLVLNGLGNYKVSPDSIVYANPAKMQHMIQFAMDNEVRTTVFDGEDELYKIAAMYGSDSKLDLLIRLDTTGADCVCNLSNKFGCPVADAPRLLAIAQKLELHCVGVCFHVGSGCRNATAYSNAMSDTCLLFEAAHKLGMTDFHIVDIGGGFPGAVGGYGGANMPTFQEVAAVIRDSIKEFKTQVSLFQSVDKLRFIAEPGRYFASAATSIATKVYSRKGGEGSEIQVLYIDDGVYGSFNNIIYDHATPEPTKVPLMNPVIDRTHSPLRGGIVRTQSPASVCSVDYDSDKVATASKAELLPSLVFGPTCDGLDQICDAKTLLPRVKVGDWLLWDNMGAYTHTASFVFNGYTHIPNKIHIVL